MAQTDLKATPLHALHVELGARMVPYAGYSMPVQYPDGLIAEHKHTRESAGLFDVSHMGQLDLVGPDAATALETLIPTNAMGLSVDRQRYGLFLTDEGTIIDDFMFVNRGDRLALIVNAACKDGDTAHLREQISARCEVRPLPDRGLLALQGPKASEVLQRLVPGVDDLIFMSGAAFDWEGADLYITRSGYTGEDGFEISVPGDHTEALARALLDQDEVKPVGLGARNSLRLESGLCLYGNDIDTSTTPIEAGLQWAIQKIRRSGGDRAGGFPGAEKILAQLDGSLPLERTRIGLIAQQRVPVRAGTELQDQDGNKAGSVSSGLLAPSINRPIAMAYVAPQYAAIGTELNAVVRGKSIPMAVTAMPFLQPHYRR